jgi:putative aminopeptidase FrvX
MNLDIEALPLTMRLDLLKQLLAVPTCYRQEERMVAFLMEHLRQRDVGQCGEITTDEWNNIFIRKGGPGFRRSHQSHRGLAAGSFGDSG